MKKAACVFVENEGKILTVTRKDNPNDIGLPGGKFDDEDETLQFTAFRECLEETGLMVNVLSDSQYVGIDNGTGEEFEVSTFLGKLTTIKATVDISENETGIVAWRDPADLVNSSSFSEYNIKMLAQGFGYRFYQYEITYSGKNQDTDIIYARDRTEAAKLFIKKAKGTVNIHSIKLI